MIRAATCERCGKTMSTKREGKNIPYISIKISHRLEDILSPDYIDLCYDCRRSFINWFDGGKEDEKNG